MVETETLNHKYTSDGRNKPRSTEREEQSARAESQRTDDGPGGRTRRRYLERGRPINRRQSRSLELGRRGHLGI